MFPEWIFKFGGTRPDFIGSEYPKGGKHATKEYVQASNQVHRVSQPNMPTPNVYSYSCKKQTWGFKLGLNTQ